MRGDSEGGFVLMDPNRKALQSS